MSFALAKMSCHGFEPGDALVRAVVVRSFTTGWHVRPVGVRATVRIWNEEENVWWARGWNTKAANALSVLVALL